MKNLFVFFFFFFPVGFPCRVQKRLTASPNESLPSLTSSPSLPSFVTVRLPLVLFAFLNREEGRKEERKKGRKGGRKRRRRKEEEMYLGGGKCCWSVFSCSYSDSKGIKSCFSRASLRRCLAS